MAQSPVSFSASHDTVVNEDGSYTVIHRVAITLPPHGFMVLVLNTDEIQSLAREIESDTRDAYYEVLAHATQEKDNNRNHNPS